MGNARETRLTDDRGVRVEVVDAGGGLDATADGGPGPGGGPGAA
ncbi:hypothetical protein [Streptomyces antimicrobicus]|nr:hypothetical protein [Streptomyces antimicrobicus]